MRVGHASLFTNHLRGFNKLYPNLHAEQQNVHAWRVLEANLQNFTLKVLRRTNATRVCRLLYLQGAGAVEDGVDFARLLKVEGEREGPWRVARRKRRKLIYGRCGNHCLTPRTSSGTLRA